MQQQQQQQAGTLRSMTALITTPEQRKSPDDRAAGRSLFSTLFSVAASGANHHVRRCFGLYAVESLPSSPPRRH